MTAFNIKTARVACATLSAIDPERLSEACDRIQQLETALLWIQREARIYNGTPEFDRLAQYADDVLRAGTELQYGEGSPEDLAKHRKLEELVRRT